MNTAIKLVPASPSIEQLTLEVSQLKAEVAVLREKVDRIEQVPRRVVRRRTVDATKVFIATLKARHPHMRGRSIAICLDNTDRAELRPLESWTSLTNLRCWHELWDHPRTQQRVRKFIYSIAPFQPEKNTDHYRQHVTKRPINTRDSSKVIPDRKYLL